MHAQFGVQKISLESKVGKVGTVHKAQQHKIHNKVMFENIPTQEEREGEKKGKKDYSTSS